MGKKAALHNLGCKVNAYETDAMRQLLEKAGYEIVPFAPGADVYVINTCTVTNIADRKSRQMLHKARKMNPQAIVVAAGCYVQTAASAEDDPAIDIVLGNNRKKDLPEVLKRFEEARAAAQPGQECCVLPPPEGKIDISRTREYENLSIVKTSGHTRAYIKVQDGCNQFCTYCIIPYARGRVRSRTAEDVLQETERLAANGCREVVLTGIHLSSYGVDLGTTLLALIQAVHEVPGVERIRLGSLEPGIVTEEFAAELAALPRLCPHFHLSLQSGCTSVLKRMNRRYTAEEFAQRCAILRQAFANPAITTDVIVGFPQETQEEFDATVAFLQQIRLYETHIFKYSRRQGTRAAMMPGQIPESEKEVRSERLIRLGQENRSRFERQFAGRPVEVLCEEQTDIAGKPYYTGYTKEYIRAAVPKERAGENLIVTGRLGEELAAHVFLLEGD